MIVVLATSNKDKVNEIKDKLDKNIEIKLPVDYNIDKFEVEEDGETLKDNAYKKASELFKLLKKPVLADDTGLFVNSLDGRPGVYSHRYANENPTYEENRHKLIEQLKDKKDRSAYFMTCICYIDESGNDYYFIGKIDGIITEAECGDYDFGYDKIFKPESSDKTFGQMTPMEKNNYSHRSIALEKFNEYLINRYKL